MPGLGVIVNVARSSSGTIIGLLFGGLITERLRQTAFKAIGLSTIVIGAGMAIGGLTDLGESAMGDYAPLVLVGSLVVGGIIGEALRIEDGLERFGEWLQDVRAQTAVLRAGRRGPERRRATRSSRDS